MKIIGALVIIFSSFMIALNASEKIDLAISSVSALRRLFEHTKNMIECYSLPVGEILRRFDRTSFADIGYTKGAVPQDFSELTENSNISDTEARELLFAFSKDFGKSYRQDEVARCSMYLEKIRSREQKLMKDSVKRKKVIFTVALCSALAVVILIM